MKPRAKRRRWPPRVEDCENWIPMSVGGHCFACGRRNGYPYRAWPSKQCRNFKPKSDPPEVQG